MVLTKGGVGKITCIMFLKETSNVTLGYYLSIYFSLNLYLLTKAFHKLQGNLSNKVK